MKLKVCGMTELEQIQTLETCGVDFAGLIFYEGSKRFVGSKSKNQKSEIRNLKIDRVGVFVNATIPEIEQAVKDYGLSYVQLHGDESPEFCKKIKEFAFAIKAIRINIKTNLANELEKFEETCDYFLFDTDSKQYGGTGKKFDWGVLQSAEIDKPFFLSGGIGLEDLAEVKAFQHPMLFAIDVNSRFEISPGVKDLQQVKTFLEQLK